MNEMHKLIIKLSLILILTLSLNFSATIDISGQIFKIENKEVEVNYGSKINNICVESGEKLYWYKIIDPNIVERAAYFCGVHGCTGCFNVGQDLNIVGKWVVKVKVNDILIEEYISVKEIQCQRDPPIVSFFLDSKKYSIEKGKGEEVDVITIRNPDTECKPVIYTLEAVNKDCDGVEIKFLDYATKNVITTTKEIYGDGEFKVRLYIFAKNEASKSQCEYQLFFKNCSTSTNCVTTSKTINIAISSSPSPCSISISEPTIDKDCSTKTMKVKGTISYSDGCDISKYKLILEKKGHEFWVKETDCTISGSVFSCEFNFQDKINNEYRLNLYESDVTNPVAYKTFTINVDCSESCKDSDIQSIKINEIKESSTPFCGEETILKIRVAITKKTNCMIDKLDIYADNKLAASISNCWCGVDSDFCDGEVQIRAENKEVKFKACFRNVCSKEETYNLKCTPSQLPICTKDNVLSISVNSVVQLNVPSCKDSAKLEISGKINTNSDCTISNLKTKVKINGNDVSIDSILCDRGSCKIIVKGKVEKNNENVDVEVCYDGKCSKYSQPFTITCKEQVKCDGFKVKKIKVLVNNNVKEYDITNLPQFGIFSDKGINLTLSGCLDLTNEKGNLDRYKNLIISYRETQNCFSNHRCIKENTISKELPLLLTCDINTEKGIILDCENKEIQINPEDLKVLTGILLIEKITTIDKKSLISKPILINVKELIKLDINNLNCKVFYNNEEKSEVIVENGKVQNGYVLDCGIKLIGEAARINNVETYDLTSIDLNKIDIDGGKLTIEIKDKVVAYKGSVIFGYLSSSTGSISINLREVKLKELEINKVSVESFFFRKNLIVELKIKGVIVLDNLKYEITYNQCNKEKKISDKLNIIPYNCKKINEKYVECDGIAKIEIWEDVAEAKEATIKVYYENIEKSYVWKNNNWSPHCSEVEIWNYITKGNKLIINLNIFGSECCNVEKKDLSILIKDSQENRRECSITSFTNNENKIFISSECNVENFDYRFIVVKIGQTERSVEISRLKQKIASLKENVNKIASVQYDVNKLQDTLQSQIKIKLDGNIFLPGTSSVFKEVTLEVSSPVSQDVSISYERTIFLAENFEEVKINRGWNLCYLPAEGAKSLTYGKDTITSVFYFVNNEWNRYDPKRNIFLIYHTQGKKTYTEKADYSYKSNILPSYGAFVYSKSSTTILIPKYPKPYIDIEPGVWKIIYINNLSKIRVFGNYSKIGIYWFKDKKWYSYWYDSENVYEDKKKIEDDIKKQEILNAGNPCKAYFIYVKSDSKEKVRIFV